MIAQPNVIRAPKIHYRVYAPDEIAAIRARYPDEGPSKLAKEMGRSARGVTAKASMMRVVHDEKKRNIGFSRMHDWTPEQEALLRMHWPDVQRRVSGHLTVAALAKKIGVTPKVLRTHARDAGIMSCGRTRPDPWTEAEIEIISKSTHLATRSVVSHLAKAGFSRSETAVGVMRSRLNIRVTDADGWYSGHQLARLMGVTSAQVSRWIKQGLLHGKPRGASKDGDGPGDRWVIRPRDVYDFACRYPSYVPLPRVDSLWFIDLLASRGHRSTTPIAIQDRCGKGDAEQQEYRCEA